MSESASKSVSESVGGLVPVAWDGGGAWRIGTHTRHGQGGSSLKYLPVNRAVLKLLEIFWTSCLVDD